MAHENSSPIYTHHPSRPGVALIIVNENFQEWNPRSAASKDFQALEDTFTRLGFEIESLYDGTDKDILEIVRKVRDVDHSNYSTFVLAVSSHGDRCEDTKKHCFRDSVDGVNWGMVNVDTLTEHFSESQCPSLKGKPKLFFIQACRGDKASETATAYVDTTTMESINSDNNSDDNTKTDVDASAYHHHGISSEDVPLRRDCLMAYSSPPGYTAFGNANGSWFIQALCQVLLEQHRRCDLVSMLTEVSHRVATEYTSDINDEEYNKRHSMPWVASMLTKQVRFYPRGKKT